MDPSHELIGGWEVFWDVSARVWRAIRDADEVNQYHKEELLWIIERIDDTENYVEGRDYIKRRVAPFYGVGHSFGRK